MDNGFAAVILAAGYSSRMKAFKPLLPVGGVTAIRRLMDAAKGAGISKIIVVTGHNREDMMSVIEGSDAMEAYNADYDRGMFSSIQTGMAYAKAHIGDLKGIFLMPVDCPLVSSSVMKELMEAASAESGSRWQASHGQSEKPSASFYVPVFEGKKGHPLLIHESYVEEICGYTGPGGLKVITDKYWDRMIRVPVSEEGCVLDMDTPEAYEEINDFLKAGCRRVELSELARGRRIFLIRHGHTRQHREKMFIGRYDVPLAEDAYKQVEEMAEALRQALHQNSGETPVACDASSHSRVIYTSPLQRTVQTAKVIAGHLNGCCCEGEPWKLCEIDDFQEISLGTWDGRPIREIKEAHPHEFRRRGKDMFAFKMGNGSENFYDVQYRAVKALRRILESDCRRDIIVVSHNAVIRALENNLKGLRVDDSWDGVDKGSFVVIDNMNMV